MVKELAESLSAAGHDVTIITGFPNHPSGVVFGGYVKKWLLRERNEGVNIERVWLATSGNRSKLMRILSFLTFTMTSSLALLRQRKPDLIFAVFQPLSMGVTLPFLAKIKKARLVLNVQDLHPDVPIELGMIRNPFLIKILRSIERWGYAQANGLAVICDSFKTHCIARGAKPAQVAVIPNWIDLDEVKPAEKDNPFRRSLGLSSDHFVVLYAGTVGWVSGAEVMLEVAKSLQDLENVRIVFVGEGPVLPQLKQDAETQGIGNIIFAPFQPRNILSQVQGMADVSVVSLKKGKGRASVPSKVLGYMAAARPVLASVEPNSETARTVMQSGCGLVVDPEDPIQLADAIRRLHADPQSGVRLGKSGREFLEKNFSRTSVIDRYSTFFKSIIQ